MLSQKIFQLKFCMFSKFSMAAELFYVKMGFMKHLMCKFLVPFCFSFHGSKFIVFLGTLFLDTHNLCYFIKRGSMMRMINLTFLFCFVFIEHVLVFNSCVFIYTSSFKQVGLGPVYMLYVKQRHKLQGRKWGFKYFYF